MADIYKSFLVLVDVLDGDSYRHFLVVIFIPEKWSLLIHPPKAKMTLENHRFQ